jgi:hypothetical protein
LDPKLGIKWEPDPKKMLRILNRNQQVSKLFAGSRYGSGTQGYGSGSGPRSGTGLNSYKKSSKLLAI